MKIFGLNISNLSENLLLIIVVGSLSMAGGGFIGYTAAVKSHKMTMQQVQPTLDRAIEKATNEITNKIEIPKIKKSEPVRIIMAPDNTQMAVQDTCIGIDLDKLTDGQKRRLERWLNK